MAQHRKFHVSGAGDISYGLCRTPDGLDVVFLDYYRKGSDASIVALQQYKSGDANLVMFYGSILAECVASVTWPWCEESMATIVPLPRSNELRCSNASSNAKTSNSIAERLDSKVDTNILQQSALRRPFHWTSWMRYPQRKEIMLASLRCKSALGKKFFLVDDIFTTGASMDASAQRIAEQGGRVVGGAVFMKVEYKQVLLNPQLYKFG